ncbi:MAG: universal stress protein [Stellaceae bacterium]
MALRDILVCLDAASNSDGRLALALNLAQTGEAHLAGKAHLTAVYTLPKPHESTAPPARLGLPPTVLGPASPDGAGTLGGEPISGAAPVAPAVREAERAESVEQRFREALPLRSLDGEWQMLNHSERAELIHLAGAADLVVLGQYPDDDADGLTWLRPDDIMIDAGRPVLVIPYAGTFEHVGKRVLIAWNGTREARRALHDALPLIGSAEALTVLHIGTRQADLDRDRPWLDRIVHHLARHGIQAHPEESPHEGISISDLLLSRAADLGADMIVAGAYHHSPLRESLLGGVSRDLLDHMTVPVLMSH